MFAGEMKPKSIATVAIVLLSSVILLALLGPIKRTQRERTMRRFGEISDAVRFFAWHHNNELPSKLSDVVPSEISLDRLEMFYHPAIRASLPSDWKTNPALIDTHSDFVYLGASGLPREILAHERDGAWPHDFGQKLIILTLGGGGTTATRSELNELLHAEQSAILERLRNLRASYHLHNLHGSLLNYHERFGSFPTGGNASIIQALFGNKGSYEEKRNSLGEQLDPWGNPYFMEGGKDEVRIKSAGTNQKLDQVGSTDFDDICFTITPRVFVDDTKF